MPEAAATHATAGRGNPKAAAAGSLIREAALTPTTGFPRLFRFASGAGARSAAKSASFLSFVGGAGGILVWLKVSGLVGARDVSPDAFRWGYVIAALILGGLVGLIGRALWVLAMNRVSRGDAREDLLRLSWGTAALPQVIALLLLLPLDLIVTGRDAFTSARLPTTFETVWAAISIAFALSLFAWSCLLLTRGVRIAIGRRVPGISVIGLAGAGLALLVAGPVLFKSVALLSGVLS